MDVNPEARPARPSPLFPRKGAGEGALFGVMAIMSFLADIISNAPIDPTKPAPEVVKAVGNNDWLEADLTLAHVGGQLRSSWIIEPADGQIPLTAAGKALATAMGRGNLYDGPEVRPMTERCVTAIGAQQPGVEFVGIDALARGRLPRGGSGRRGVGRCGSRLLHNVAEHI